MAKQPPVIDPMDCPFLEVRRGAAPRVFFALGPNHDGTALSQTQLTVAAGHTMAEVVQWFASLPRYHLLRPGLIADVKTKDERFVNTFIMDLDASDNVEQGDRSPAVATAVVECLRRTFTNGDELDFEYVVFGGQVPDKGNSWSYHIYFPGLARPKISNRAWRKLKDAVNEVLEPFSLNYDYSISGIAVWNSDKYLKDNRRWRSRCKQVLLTNADATIEVRGLHRNICPLVDADAGYLEAPLIAEQVHRAQRRAREGDDEAENDDDRPPPADLLALALQVYGEEFNPGANVRRTVYRADSNTWMVHLDDPRDQNLCPLHGRVHHDNHYFRLSPATRKISVWCGHHGDEMGYEMALPAPPRVGWLQQVLEGAGIDTPYFADDYVQRKLQPPDGAPPYTAESLCISVEVFNSLANDEERVRYFNLCVSLSADHLLIRRGSGRVARARIGPQTSASFARFYTIEELPRGKQRRVGFFDVWCAHPLASSHCDVAYYRRGQAQKPHVLNLIIPARVPPPLQPVDDLVSTTVGLYLEIYLRCLVWATVPMNAAVSQDDFREELFKFMLDWLTEVVCGHRKVPFIVSLCEDAGGVGKSAITKMIECLLGSHQVVSYKSAEHMVKETFGPELIAQRRLIILDDPAGVRAGSGFMSAFKDIITRTRANMNIKHGENGVHVDCYDAFIGISNKNPIHPPATDRERRTVIVEPAAASAEIIAHLREAGALSEEEEEIIANYNWEHGGHEHFLRQAHSELGDLLNGSLVWQQAMAQLLEARWTPQLNEQLRLRIESQSLSSTALSRTRREEHSTVAQWIVDRLVHNADGSFWSRHERIAKPNSTIFIARDVASHAWSIDTLLVLYNLARPDAPYQSVSTFKQQFVSDFNMLCMSYNSVNPFKANATATRRMLGDEYRGEYDGSWQMQNADGVRQRCVVFDARDFQAEFLKNHPVNDE